MNRRQLLLSAGMVAGSAGGLIGVGAFSSAQIDRSVNIDVVNDAQGLIGLVPNDDVAGVQLSETTGELSIDLGEEGVNTNSIYQFGHFDTVEGFQDGPSIQEVPIDEEEIEAPPQGNFPITSENPAQTDLDGNFDSAFVVRNQTDSTRSVQITFSPDPGSIDSSPPKTRFIVEAHHADHNPQRLVYGGGFSGYQLEFSVDELDPGDALGVSFLVDSREGDGDDSFSGSLLVEAGEIAN